MTEQNSDMIIAKVRIYILLCPNFLSDITSLQGELIHEWCADLRQAKINTIPNAHIDFRRYSFSEYRDQDKLKAYIRDNFTNSRKEIYWAGTAYEDYETLYNELSEQKCVLELVVYEI